VNYPPSSGSTYGVFDRRIARSHDTNGDGTVDVWEFYTYDGEDVLLDFADADGPGPGGFLLARRCFPARLALPEGCTSSGGDARGGPAARCEMTRHWRARERGRRDSA
jgi:hypothetical protein